MIERRIAALSGQVGGGLGDGNFAGSQRRPAAAGLAEARQVEREAVADVDGGVNFGVFGQPERFAHPRRKVEVFSQNAAAKTSGDEDCIAGTSTAAPPAAIR